MKATHGRRFVFRTISSDLFTYLFTYLLCFGARHCGDQFLLCEILRKLFGFIQAFVPVFHLPEAVLQISSGSGGTPPSSRPKQIFHIRHVFGQRTQNFNKFSLINWSHYLGQYILILTLTTQFISSREYTSINELKVFVCHFSFRSVGMDGNSLKTKTDRVKNMPLLQLIWVFK